MSPMVNITTKDLLRSRVLEAGWYRIKVDNVGEKPASNGESINYPLEGTVICQGDTGATKDIAGIPVYFNFNSKAISMCIPFVEAITGQKVEKETRIDLAAAVNEEVDAFIQPDTYNGRLQNKLTGQFRPVRKDVSPVPAE